MVATSTDSTSNSEDEDFSTIPDALFLVKRQLQLMDDSVQSTLWQLKEVQRLENLGVTDVPITVSELIKKLELLMLENAVIVKTMVVITVRLSLMLFNTNRH
jgi:hypothetical protein